ncbi:MAG: HTTM domain-containing protein [Planctomycetota bacterium]
MMLAVYDAIGRFAPAIAQHVGSDHASFVDRPWNPIFALELLGLGPPSPALADLTHSVVFWSMLFAFVGLFTRIACITLAISFTYMAAVHYSLGKPHHDCVQLTFGIWALALSPAGGRISVDSCIRRLVRALRGQGRGPVASVATWAAFPIRATQISIAIGYFFAGATKLAIGGLPWANGYTLQAIMLSYRSPWSGALSDDVFLCQLMQVGLLAVQGTFPLVFLHPWLRWFYVPMAVVFHLMAMQTMNTGHFMTLWFPLLGAFIAWERVPDFLRRNVRDARPPKRLATLALLAGASWIVASIYFAPRPPWMAWSVVVPLGAFLWIVRPRRSARSTRPAPS